MITPTNGRIVWYTPATNADRNISQLDPSAQLAAMVVHVWDDRTVNLVVFTSEGYPVSRSEVTLVQPDDMAPEDGRYCVWMPYQLGQAAKAASDK
jgi:hypothetical protein